MTEFTVREYAFISVAYKDCPETNLAHAYIPEKAFEHLCELAASFSKHGAKVFELAGRRKLKLDQYVGVIETPCGTRIEILPKHIEFNGANDQEIIRQERKLLQKMLSVSLHLPYREVGSANLNRFKQPLHEWIITQFLKCFEHLVQRGLRFNYNRVQEEQKFLRGQLQHV
ncbi:5-methylcytosine restriction system specificity protein McrC, partial [Acinetobacter gerneri]|uniref:5-methylcytosine restriction system specificity protein McrC n=1 Tax=Acinetobacter gerneri TaxID=202952 RepID=UPI00406CB348